MDACTPAVGGTVFTAFGLLAAIVGAIGLYSVLTSLVIEQRRIYAIELAVGATHGQVAIRVLRFAMLTAFGGMALGYLALLPSEKLIEPLLFHTRLLEAPTVFGVIVAGAVVALLAVRGPLTVVLRRMSCRSCENNDALNLTASAGFR